MRPRRRRRRTSTRRAYSIAYLLAHQPKGLARQANYREMMRIYHASERLQSVRFSRRCYSLLQHAKIDPHNLHHFYRTYRLPESPFFPLFFAAKRAWLAERERVREERRAAIRDRVRALPGPTVAMIRYLGHLERHYNAAGRSPLWQELIFPGSKKEADALARATQADWLARFGRHLDAVVERYRGVPEDLTERVLALYLLELTPTEIPPPRPPAAELARTYRRLSLLHHPDRGGDSAMFIRIKRARDVLAESGAVRSRREQ